MEYYIYMTNNCNMMCSYCSELFDCQKHKIPMGILYPKEKLVSFIRETQSHQPDKNVTIFFFGGEPSLEYKKIAEYISYLKSELKEYDVSFVLHTNGLLLHEIPLDVLKSLRMITLSINYERMPAYHLKDSYFETIMKGIERVRENSDCKIAGRLTLSSKTSLYCVVKLFGDFCDNLYWQLENCAQFSEPEKYMASMKYETEILFKEWFNELKKGHMLPWIPFMSVLKFMFYPDRDDEHFCCGYDGHQVYIQTQGSCFACCDSVPGGQHCIGSLDKGIKFNVAQPINFEWCRNCEYRRLCMGRCGRMHVDFTKEHVLEYCDINKNMFNLFLDNKNEFEIILKKYPNLKDEFNSWFIDVTECIP